MSDIEATLRNGGIRVTEARRVLLRHLRAVGKAQTVQELHDAVGGDLVTIYRTVALFVAHGLLREIKLAGTAVLYEDALLDHHHHAICTGCGVVAELPECDVARHQIPAPKVPGFRVITAHTLEYAGLCVRCGA